VGVQNDVTEFARLDGDIGERDRLRGFHWHRDLAQIIRRSHNRPAPAWSWNNSASPDVATAIATGLLSIVRDYEGLAAAAIIENINKIACYRIRREQATGEFVNWPPSYSAALPFGRPKCSGTVDPPPLVSPSAGGTGRRSLAVRGPPAFSCRSC
jgi:hypothetical protein